MSIRIPPEVAVEIDNFESEMNRYLSGELAPERFKAFRLSYGIYGQRQDGVQMVRVKIPSGSLNVSAGFCALLRSSFGAHAPPRGRD